MMRAASSSALQPESSIARSLCRRWKSELKSCLGRHPIRWFRRTSRVLAAIYGCRLAARIHTQARMRSPQEGAGNLEGNFDWSWRSFLRNRASSLIC
jgi:hypothetical protein